MCYHIQLDWIVNRSNICTAYWILQSVQVSLSPKAVGIVRSPVFTISWLLNNMLLKLDCLSNKCRAYWILQCVLVLLNSESCRYSETHYVQNKLDCLIICNCIRSLIRYLQSLLDPQSSKPKKCTK